VDCVFGLSFLERIPIYCHGSNLANPVGG
jgi:hypothetical protein